MNSRIIAATGSLFNSRSRFVRRSLIWLALLIPAPAFFAGCASLSRSFATPVVSLRDVRLVGLGATGGSLSVVLNVYNPNGYRLDATRLSYRLLVDSTQIGQGVNDATMRVQAGDSTIVSLPVDFTFATLGVAAQKLMNSGVLDYRIVGDLTVATPIGSYTRPFDQRGRYTVLRDEPLSGSGASAGK